jgi:hypothetical protein
MKKISGVALLLVANSAIAGSVVKLESRDHDSNPPGKLVNETVLISSENRDIDAALFVPSAEYQQSSLNQGVF